MNGYRRLIFGLVMIASLAAAIAVAGPGHDHGAPAGATCGTHGAPADLCFICDPALREPGRLWCNGHNRYEDRCWQCQPQLREEGRAYCESHGLYEDECFLCRPELAAARGETAGAGTELYCTEHDLPENECGICHPELVGTLGAGNGLKLRLPSARSAALGGLTVEKPQLQPSRGRVTAYAEIGYDRNRLAHVTPLVGGVIRRVLVDLGTQVQGRDVLLEISSAEVATAKTTYVSAILERDLCDQDLQRERKLFEQQIAAERDLQAAEASHARAAATAAAAAQNLRNLGLDETAIARVTGAGDATALYELRAPFAGEVIQRHAVLGEAVAAGEPLLQVADLSRMWLELAVPESALPDLQLGLTVTARFDALPGVEVRGELSWIGSGLDERTRLVRARAVIDNPDGLLKAGLYGDAALDLGLAEDALTVPVAAVHELDGTPIVFVREQDDLYSLRRIEPGRRLGDRTAVIAGLTLDDSVVSQGSFALYTELLKSRLGAGCAHE